MSEAFQYTNWPVFQYINKQEQEERTCPSCGGSYIVIGKKGQKSGASPRINIPHKGIVQGYCSSLCGDKALGVQDVSEGLDYKALKDMGIDPFTMLAPKLPPLDGRRLSFKQLSIMEYLLQMKLQAERKIDPRSAKIDLSWLAKSDDGKTTKAEDLNYEVVKYEAINYKGYAARLIWQWSMEVTARMPGLAIDISKRSSLFAQTLAENLGAELVQPDEVADFQSKRSPRTLRDGNILVGDVFEHEDELVPVIDSIREKGISFDYAAFLAIIDRGPSGFKKLSERNIASISALDVRGITPEGKFMFKSINPTTFLQLY